MHRSTTLRLLQTLEHFGYVTRGQARGEFRLGLRLYALGLAASEQNGTMADIVKTTVYLGDVSDYAGMNEVYRSYFPEGPPARATLVTGFVVPGLLVEIEAIAALD